MFIVPVTLKWKNNDPRRESAIFSPLAVLVNKVLLGEIYSLPACVLSTAHAALPELSSYNREQSLTKSERVSICFFRVKFAKPRAKSFTWFSGERGKLREDSASWLSSHHKHFSNIYKAGHLTKSSGDRHSRQHSLPSLWLYIPAHRASPTDLPENPGPVCVISLSSWMQTRWHGTFPLKFVRGINTFKYLLSN